MILSIIKKFIQGEIFGMNTIIEKVIGNQNFTVKTKTKEEMIENISFHTKQILALKKNLKSIR